MNSRTLLVLWIWGAAMVAVSTGELLPGGSAPIRWIAATGLSDKTLHFSAYLLLAVIPVVGFQQRRGVLAALSMILLGFVLDRMQSLIPGRSFEIADLLANALGVGAGIVLGVATARLRTPYTDT